jgi:hypothetical protein
VVWHCLPSRRETKRFDNVADTIEYADSLLKAGKITQANFDRIVDEVK